MVTIRAGNHIDAQPPAGGAPERLRDGAGQVAVGPSVAREVPCLLTMPTYDGTLAAVRALGRDGIEVTVAGNEWLAPARWSRHARRFVRCPVPRDPRFLSWLLRFGERHPGHFLYPTSDDIAWLIAANAEALSRHFLLFQPPLSTVVSLLDKRRLHARCIEVGIPTLPTWFPSSVEEAEALLPSLPMPVVIKPRTQVFLASWSHGRVVEKRREVLVAFRDSLARDHYLDGPQRDFGELRAPMLQAYRSASGEGVYSLAGFVDRSGQLLGARASHKIVQRPRGVGIGLLFQHAPVDPALLDGLARLCRRTGYFGVFEAEFIPHEGRHHLIDFNPRYYGQMQFEISRGLALPLLAYYSAVGNAARVVALAEAGGAPSPPATTYAFGFGLRMVSALRGLLGRPVDRRSALRDAPPGARSDASADPEDWLPGWVHAASEVVSAARHPRAFYRGNLR